MSCAGVGHDLRLRRKVFQVLVYLLEQRDRVVSRDEVLAQVWPDQYVGEETSDLLRQGGAPRRGGQRAHAAGDSDRARPWATLHRRRVTVTDAPPAAPPGTPPPPPR